MSQPEIIVYGTADVSRIPMTDDNNTFTGTNTFNVVNGTVGTITTFNSTTINVGLGTLGTIVGTVGTVSTFNASTITSGSVTIKNGTTFYSENATDASYTLMTNSTASPQADGFNIKWQNTGVGTAMGTNNDCLIIEKTDGNNADPDGAIQFVMTGNDTTQEVAMNIWGNKVVELYGTLNAPAGTIHTLTNGTINSTQGTFSGTVRIGGATDYIELGQDYGVKMAGTTQVWDDLQVNINSVRLPAAGSPTFTAYKGGYVLDFDKAAVNTVYFNAQYPHSYSTASDWDFHIHTIAPDNVGGTVVWKFTYTGISINGTYPTQGTVYGTQVLGTVDQDVHTLFSFGTFSGAGLGISSVFVCSLAREGTATEDAYNNSIYVSAVDFHIQKDTTGSRTQSAK